MSSSKKRKVLEGGGSLFTFFESKESLVTCPMCQKGFKSKTIEVHASSCGLVEPLVVGPLKPQQSPLMLPPVQREPPSVSFSSSSLVQTKDAFKMLMSSQKAEKKKQAALTARFRLDLVEGRLFPSFTFENELLQQTEGGGGSAIHGGEGIRLGIEQQQQQQREGGWGGCTISEWRDEIALRKMLIEFPSKAPLRDSSSSSSSSSTSSNSSSTAGPSASERQSFRLILETNIPPAPAPAAGDHPAAAPHATIHPAILKSMLQKGDEGTTHSLNQIL